ncbi:DNA cytosine methyltransferase [Sphingobacterium deserti]|uniref:Cytosine-specific methyltransferase n=1 Tax=Sphingobacterium deserti TaxID=1229276 RepID=A0A0B8T0G6_9SPHI|nr:DNA cytosine methyltransferase [Sphingobacterium deserti]KGE13796.1 putative cytosine-specific methyltransferase [Sphingobacterium deserti]
MAKNTYIDLFAGCGGLSLGFYNSKEWEASFAIEKSPDAFETLKYNLIERHEHFNWPSWLPLVNHDINDIIKKYDANLRSLRGQIDLVAGGPPCQGFSTAGRRIENDKRNMLIESYVNFIRLVQPKLIFFENVKGFTQKFDKNKVKGRVYSEYVKSSLSRVMKKENFPGYEVHGKLIDFSDFGVPQKRTRFILVGIRKDLDLTYTSKDFFDLLISNKTAFAESKGISVSTTLEDAISDLLRIQETACPDSIGFRSGLYNNISSDFQRLLRHGCFDKVPDSHRFARHSDETVKKFQYLLKFAERGKSLSKEIKERYDLKKRTIIPLAGNQPTPTITTLPDDYIHYSEPRIFTVREYARIQSFNDWYKFKSKYTTGGKRRTKEVPRYSQIGNAIPPLFGEQAGVILNIMIRDNAKKSSV